MVARVRDRLPDLKHVFAAGGDTEHAETFESLLSPATEVTPDLGPDDIIQLLYTSGTTGEPKASCTPPTPCCPTSCPSPKG